jgi:RNA-directed DNA polymerase
MDNMLNLQKELEAKDYRHGSYYAFKINDPKPRDIHKAIVRDRIVHHAVYKILYPYFDKKFIYDSYSCRNAKGTHRAMKRFQAFGRKISQNNTQTAWVLKGDIQKFFANIDHDILREILNNHISDENILWLLNQIIDSFHTENATDIGLPLGNVTSQLLINVYMNEFDQFVKRELKIHFYIRYADDFVIFHQDRQYLENLIPKISDYLNIQLKLTLHPKKLFIKPILSGIDFLGWVHFPYHRVLRTTTKRRMLKNLKHKQTKESLASYLGLLKHGNAHKLAMLIQGLESKMN